MRLPAPSWLTLKQALDWLVEQGILNTHAKSALTRAFLDGDIWTRAYSEYYFGHDKRGRLSDTDWYQATVDWDTSCISAPNQSSGPPVFVDVEVERRGLEVWIRRGAADLDQHAVNKSVISVAKPEESDAKITARPADDEGEMPQTMVAPIAGPEQKGAEPSAEPGDDEARSPQRNLTEWNNRKTKTQKQYLRWFNCVPDATENWKQSNTRKPSRLELAAEIAKLEIAGGHGHVNYKTILRRLDEYFIGWAG